jgi:hypothetical protein
VRQVFEVKVIIEQRVSFLRHNVFVLRLPQLIFEPFRFVFLDPLAEAAQQVGL